MKTCSECGQAKPETEYRKHSTGHTMRYCNDCHLAKRRAQHHAKRKERNAQFRARYATNANGIRDKYAAARKAKYAKEGRAAIVAWIAANPEKAAEAQRQKMKRGRQRLSDYYVRRLLTHPERSTVREVPTVLIECKRLQLMIERECHDKR
jgi:pyruvate/2-oxoglutarate dehydrogenase complex dihydrolipoamide acyltransferase (E2) component